MMLHTTGDIDKISFIQIMNELGDEEYLLAFLTYMAAPTLDSLKPATLLNLTGRLRAAWKRVRLSMLNLLSINCFDIADDHRHCTMLLYRKHHLETHLMEERVRHYLIQSGYSRASDAKSHLVQLKTRFERSFPHEIGCFLGIPVHDVEGFILHKGLNYILNGYWKVYHNPEWAKQQFLGYTMAREKAMKAIMNRYMP